METILGWRRRGLKLKEVAHNLGIGHNSLCKYANQYPELRKVLLYGGIDSIIQVENALHNSALGQVVTLHKTRLTNDGTVVGYDTQEYIPPNVMAQQFILKNLASERWSDKVKIETKHEFGIRALLDVVAKTEIDSRNHIQEIASADPVTMLGESQDGEEESETE
jgi:hypothetical protein